MALLIIMLPVCVADELQLTYDANGNLLSEDGFTRTYNSLNQLTQIQNSTGSLLEEFVYHPTEERIYKKIVYDSAGGVKETITYFTADFVRISNSSGTFDTTYVMHEGQKVVEVRYDGAKQFMHDDHLGSTGAITDSVGTVVEQTTYSPFGEIVSGGELSRFDYEGKEYDSVVGDYDFNFRKYCVKFGIFCQPDTLIQNVYDPQSLNRYMFERGNPYNRVDPTGHYGQFLYYIFRAINFVWQRISQSLPANLPRYIWQLFFKEEDDAKKDDEKLEEPAEQTPPEPASQGEDRETSQKNGKQSNNPFNMPISNALLRNLPVNKQNLLVQNMVRNRWNIQLNEKQAETIRRDSTGRGGGSVRLADGTILTTVPGYAGIVKITPVKSQGRTKGKTKT